MKIKTQLTLAAVIAAGMLASGCSQMGAQQVSASPEPQAPAPEVKTVLDCSSCNKPAAPAMQGGAHTHPAVPACTNTISHTHKFTNSNHKHAYSCKKGPARQKLVKPPSRTKLVRPPVRVRTAPVRVNKWAHTHPAVPGCTNSITHSHPYNNARHSHRYSCRGQRVAQQPRRVAQPQRVAPAVNKWAHTHPAVPGCTNSITHVHPYNNANHSHRYSCRGNFRPQPQPQYRQPAMPMPVMPKIKAKGTYRGPIQIDGGVMQQYQQ